MAGDMAAPSNASACWQTLANSLADKFASSRGQLSATSSCAALLCGAQYISLAIPVEHSLLLRSENLIALDPLHFYIQPAGTAAALLLPGAGVHPARAWPDDVLVPGDFQDIAGCCSFACARVVLAEDAAGGTSAADANESAPNRIAWQAEVGDAVGLLLVGWRGHEEAASFELVLRLAAALSPALGRLAPALREVASAAFLSAHLSSPRAAECSAALTRLLSGARQSDFGGDPGTGHPPCRSDHTPGGGGGAGGSSGTLPVQLDGACELTEGASGRGHQAAGAGGALHSSGPARRQDHEGGQALSPAQCRHTACSASAGHNGQQPGDGDRAPVGFMDSGQGAGEGVLEGVVAGRLPPSNSVTLPPLPLVWNPFGAMRRWTSDDESAATSERDGDGSASERSYLRQASTPAQARSNPWGSSQRWAAEEDGGSGAPSSQASSFEFSSPFRRATSATLPRASSVTLPPPPAVLNPFSAARLRPWPGDTHSLTSGEGEACVNAEEALLPLPSTRPASAGSNLPVAAGAGGAIAAGTGSGGAPAGLPLEASASPSLMGGVVAAVAGPPPPPRALPFEAHVHEAFTAGPGEGSPALPPLWPSTASPLRPVPALPFAAQLDGFGREGSVEPAPLGAGSATQLGNGVARRPPAPSLGSLGAAAGAGFWGEGLMPSDAPPRPPPPPAFPFEARARRGFNRRDSTDSTAGELAPVLPLLLPSMPHADVPEALPFAARAAAGFTSSGEASDADEALAQDSTAPVEALEAADPCMGLPRSGLLSALSGSKSARGLSSDFHVSFEGHPVVSGRPVQAVRASMGAAADSDAGRSCAVRAGGSGAVGGGAGRKEGLQMPAHHPVWLTFKDAKLEEKFRIWHSTQLSKVDSISVGFALVIFLWLGFCEPHRLAYHAPVASSAIIAFMVFMAILPRLSLTRYVEHREVMAKLLCFLYTVFNALVAFPRVLTAIQPGGGLCNVAWVLRYCNAQPLLTSNVVTMVRFRLQVPVQLACLALSLALPVAVCGACTPGLRCLARLYAAQLLLGGVLPAAIVHFSERRFRRNFFSQLHQA